MSTLLTRERHGLSGSRAYLSWSYMMTRCYNKNRKQYKDYGGRGIFVCARWHSAANFVSDMGQPPLGYSLDRIDNNREYSKDNCRWSDVTTQAHNKRSNVLVSVGDEVKILSDWCRVFGINISTVKTRRRLGLSWEDSLRLTTIQVRDIRKQTCAKGHTYKGDNVGVSRGKRYCRICQRNKSRSRRKKMALAVSPSVEVA